MKHLSSKSLSLLTLMQAYPFTIDFSN